MCGFWLSGLSPAPMRQFARQRDFRLALAGYKLEKLLGEIPGFMGRVDHLDFPEFFFGFFAVRRAGCF